MRLIDADVLGLNDFEIMMCNGSYKVALERLINKISDAPTIDPVKHGHWIMHTSELYPSDSTMECDQCHHEQTIFMTDDTYCPNCGAKMEEEDNADK